MSETAGEVGKSIEIKNTGDFLLKPDFQWNTATLNSVGSESLYPSHVLETALQARLPSPLAALNMTAPEFLPERKHRNGRNYSVEGKNGERDGHFGQENKLAGGRFEYKCVDVRRDGHRKAVTIAGILSFLNTRGHVDYVNHKTRRQSYRRSVPAAPGGAERYVWGMGYARKHSPGFSSLESCNRRQLIPRHKSECSSPHQPRVHAHINLNFVTLAH
eukprot:95554-Amorphochlora_amoeboformis.AAC.1